MGAPHEQHQRTHTPTPTPPASTVTHTTITWTHFLPSTYNNSAHTNNRTTNTKAKVTICRCICVYSYVHVCVYVCAHMCMCMCTPIRPHVWVGTCVHVQVGVYMCMYLHVWVHMCMCTCTTIHLMPHATDNIITPTAIPRLCQWPTRLHLSHQQVSTNDSNLYQLDEPNGGGLAPITLAYEPLRTQYTRLLLSRPHYMGTYIPKRPCACGLCA